MFLGEALPGSSNAKAKFLSSPWDSTSRRGKDAIRMKMKQIPRRALRSVRNDKLESQEGLAKS
jgi:hypothetical protein